MTLCMHALYLLQLRTEEREAAVAELREEVAARDDTIVQLHDTIRCVQQVQQVQQTTGLLGGESGRAAVIRDNYESIAHLHGGAMLWGQ